MKTMGDVQMLFPMEPKEFWQKLKTIVEQVVIEHNNTVPLLGALDKNGQRPLLKASEVCAMFKISKPTWSVLFLSSIYHHMKHQQMKQIIACCFRQCMN